MENANVPGPGVLRVEQRGKEPRRRTVRYDRRKARSTGIAEEYTPPHGAGPRGAMKVTHFHDRAEAGALLTALLEPLVQQPVVVAGIPRGGLAVAQPIAMRLPAPLTVAFARK